MSATGEAASKALGSDDGATLLEMLVVMGLLTLATGIVFPSLRRPYEALAAETARARIAADLRIARAEAIRTNRTVAFDISADGRTYGWGDRRAQLPDAARLVASSSPIRFSPDGAADGAEITIIPRHGRRYGLAVEGPVGVVHLERSP